MTLILPFPPSVNRIWRTVQGRIILSAVGRKYRQDVAVAVHQSNVVPFGANRIDVLIELYEPDRRRRDIDNVPKALFDALQAARVFDDDSQVDMMLVARRGVDRANPRVEVTIKGNSQEGV